MFEKEVTFRTTKKMSIVVENVEGGTFRNSPSKLEKNARKNVYNYNFFPRCCHKEDSMCVKLYFFFQVYKFNEG